jgi:hypothetical protein
MRIGIAGVALLVVFGVGLLTRITDRTGTLKPEPALVEIRAEGNPLNTETVDLKNGNIHLQIPIRAATKKP